MRSGIISLSLNDGDDQPRVQPAPRKEPAEERRDPATDDGDLVPLVPPRPPQAAQATEEKGPPVWQDPTAILEQEVSRDSASEQRKPRFGEKRQKVKHSETLPTSSLTSVT